MPGLYQPSFFPLTIRFFILGAFLGLFYDVFRIRRIASFLHSEGAPSKRQNGIGRFLNKICLLETSVIFIEDLMFWTASAVAVILANYVLCRGIVRFYTVLCVGAGFTAYYFTVGKLTVKFAKVIISFIRKMICLIFGYTLRPILALFEKIYLLLRAKIAKLKAISYSKKAAADFLSLADRAFLK